MGVGLAAITGAFLDRDALFPNGKWRVRLKGNHRDVIATFASPRQARCPRLYCMSPGDRKQRAFARVGRHRGRMSSSEEPGAEKSSASIAARVYINRPNINRRNIRKKTTE